jgi:Na+-transporting methylmalonyl-CoA/oxaloacetate decarboxylase gamma subunit
MFYSFFFMGAFGVEMTIIVLSYITFGVLIGNNFLLLTGMTAVAMVLFLIEGILLLSKFNPKRKNIQIQGKVEETFEMDERRHIQKIVKIICIFFSIAFIVTTISYWALSLVLHSEIYYLGIVAVALLFPFLISIAFVMAVSAKNTIDKEIEREEKESSAELP